MLDQAPAEEAPVNLVDLEPRMLLAPRTCEPDSLITNRGRAEAEALRERRTDPAARLRARAGSTPAAPSPASGARLAQDRRHARGDSSQALNANATHEHHPFCGFPYLSKRRKLSFPPGGVTNLNGEAMNMINPAQPSDAPVADNQPWPPPIPDPFIKMNPITADATLDAGQTVTLTFQVTSWSGDVSTRVDGLPSGVTASVTLSTLSSRPFAFVIDLYLTLSAAPNADVGSATVQLMAILNIESQPARDAQSTISLNTRAVGQVFPSYQLLTLIYAPPGTNNGRGNSQVSYQNGSNTGTTTSTSNSFKSGTSVTASGGASVGIVSLGADAQFTASSTRTDSGSLQIGKSSSYQITVPGQAVDGINHDYDKYYLWLNPELDVTMTTPSTIAWQLAVNGPTMLIQYVLGMWLKDPSKMPAGVAQALSGAGITPNEYPQILAMNPYASANPSPDRNRYLPTPYSFPYEPPPTASDPVPTTTYSVSNSSTTTQSEQVQTQYETSFTLSASFKLTSVFSASLKVQDSWQWTDTSQTTDSWGSTQSCSVTIGGPAFGYQGPTDVLVYWDTVFNSFMFRFASGAPAISGRIASNDGQPLPHEPLTLDVNDVTYHTLSDANGDYRVYNVPDGDGIVMVRDERFPVSTGSGRDAASNIRLGASPNV